MGFHFHNRAEEARYADTQIRSKADTQSEIHVGEGGAAKGEGADGATRQLRAVIISKDNSSDDNRQLCRQMYL